MAVDWNVLPNVLQAHLIGNTRNSYIFFSELFRWFSELLSTWKSSNSSSPCFQTFHICIGKWLTLFTAAAKAWPPLLELNRFTSRFIEARSISYMTNSRAQTRLPWGFYTFSICYSYSEWCFIWHITCTVSYLLFFWMVLTDMKMAQRVYESVPWIVFRLSV